MVSRRQVMRIGTLGSMAAAFAAVASVPDVPAVTPQTESKPVKERPLLRQIPPGGMCRSDDINQIVDRVNELSKVLPS